MTFFSSTYTTAVSCSISKRCGLYLRISWMSATGRSKSTCVKSTSNAFSATSKNPCGGRTGGRGGAVQAMGVSSRLGADQLALGFAGLGIGGTLAVIGFFEGAMGLGHEGIPAREG